MRELSLMEMEQVNGGGIAEAGAAVGLMATFIAGYNSLTSFGSGLGIGLHKAMNRRT